MAIPVLLFLLFFTTIHAQQTPQRILSLAPNITEMIYRIGAGDKLVGRTDFCLYPPQASEKQSIGGLLNPDYETMISLQPDIIFLLPAPDMESRLQALGLATRALPNETIEEILSGLQTMGQILGYQDRAQQVISGIRDTLDFITRETTTRDSLPTLLLVGREPGSIRGLYSAGKATYLTEILNLCGGKNVLSDVPLRYFDVSREDLLIRDPQVIFDFRIGSGEKPVDVAKELQAWESEVGLQAVRRKNVFVLTDRAFLIPGPRIAGIALQLHQYLSGVRR